MFLIIQGSAQPSPPRGFLWSSYQMPYPPLPVILFLITPDYFPYSTYHFRNLSITLFYFMLIFQLEYKLYTFLLTSTP